MRRDIRSADYAAKQKDVARDFASACRSFVQRRSELTETRGFKYCKSLDRGAESRGTPDMDVVPTDEKNVRRTIRTGVSDALRSHYGDVLKETIPTRLTELSERLDEPQRDGPGLSQAEDKK
jgi:hypothetical protein